jgi:RimJ/RimL family protein N-acetyltransferase
MVDPSNALQSFQEELLRRTILLRRTELDPTLFVYRDSVGEEQRITYARLDNKTVTALVMFTPIDPFEETPRFGIGYAVPKAYRKQGRAKEAVRSSIAALQDDLRLHGHLTFYIEAIVGVDNMPSRCVAEQLLSMTPKAIIETDSGLPALRYRRRISV